MPPSFHPDFSPSWCQRILNASTTTIVEIPTDSKERIERDTVAVNTMFRQTLYRPYAIRAQIIFTRPTSEPDALTPTEYCFLLSIGDGVDGKRGRAHGGLDSLLLDQITGSAAAKLSGTAAPPTARLEVDFKAPVVTPGVILCRAWCVERSGRKIWAKGVIEDGDGKVLARGKSLLLAERVQQKL